MYVSVVLLGNQNIATRGHRNFGAIGIENYTCMNQHFFFFCKFIRYRAHRSSSLKLYFDES